MRLYMKLMEWFTKISHIFRLRKEKEPEVLRGIKNIFIDLQKKYKQ
ncbi:MAG: hypothetical protein H6Q13_1714 [Bacteroidetes bacterium]|jgi:hypothetical protein|nr:hypothetical protein [Bacteroidota bacterium]